jgi:hypothetical protein
MEEKKSNPAQKPGRKGSWIKRISLFLLAAFVIIQFIQPGKNNQSMDMTHDISKVVNVPDGVHQVLITSCYDCHSNNTNYPWYANIQPVGWWLKDHIDEGKGHLNFQEFALVEPRPNSEYNTKEKRQDHKLEEVAEMVEEGEMPLESYTLIHGDAKLSAEQKKLLLDWVTAARAEIMKPTAPNAPTLP